MKINISGSSGYLGALISNELKKRNHEVFAMSRTLLYGPQESLSENIRGAEVIINLGGAPILQRWTKSNQKEIYNSRVITTKNLVKAIEELPKDQRPKKFISISAIGIYKTGIQHDEYSTQFDDGFVGKVVKDWEAALSELPADTKKIIFRTGLVLGKNAKTIKNLVLPFKLGLGATIGSGKQAFPFVHEKDVVRAFVWAVEEFDHNGLFNLVAPDSVTQKDFTKALAKSLHRPAFLNIPPLFLKLVFGKASFLITESPTVIAKNLTDKGFKFEYPTLNLALKEII